MGLEGTWSETPVCEMKGVGRLDVADRAGLSAL